jgi:hypothetical protein
MADPVPHAFPMQLRDQVKHELRGAGITEENARFAVRRLIANAYAAGFQDGWITGADDAWGDAQAKYAPDA